MPHTRVFNKLLKGTKKTYLGKPVPLKFREKYGKRYDLKETKSVAYAIAKSRGINVDKKK